MSTGIQESNATDSKKRGRKTRSSGDSKGQKVYFYLSPDAIKRVGVAASMKLTDKSSIVEMALQKQLGGLVFYDARAKSSDPAAVATEEGSAI